MFKKEIWKLQGILKEIKVLIKKSESKGDVMKKENTMGKVNFHCRTYVKEKDNVWDEMTVKNRINVKEHIINVTTELLERYGGDTKRITARIIAEKAGIGLGLINYHFGSKDNLITICVQRIIEKVVADFKMEKDFETDKERLTAWAVYVFHFLFEHPAISKISILGDLHSYSMESNSVHTQKGFMLALKQDVADEDKAILSFILTAAMQVAFLGSGTVKELLGYDFTKTEDRSAYIEKLADVLFEGVRREIM